MVDFFDFYNCDREVEVLISYKYKFVYFIISKNGCSSILSSILHYEYPEFKYNNDNKVWDQFGWVSLNNKQFIYRFNLLNSKNLLKELHDKDYTFFVSIRNPLDRFISWANEYNNIEIIFGIYGKWNTVKKTTNQEFINEYLNLLNKDFHAIPQTIILNVYDKLCDELGINLEYVNGNDLPEYFKQLTGVELIKNNIKTDSQRVITKDKLTEDELKQINEIINTYETHPKIKELINNG